MAGNAVRHSAQELATRVMQAPLHSFQRLRKNLRSIAAVTASPNTNCNPKNYVIGVTS
jgi:hypothetical protein